MKYITASDLYNYKKCRYRPFMDHNGDPSKKVEVHPLVKLLWDAGVQYESKVIDSIRRDDPGKSFVELSKDEPASEALAKKTLELMSDGVDYIYQGVLVAGNKMGRPDLLVRDGKHYYPMDIKLAQVDGNWDNGDEKLKKEQLWQIHFYGDLLERVQKVRPKFGYIYKTKSRKLPVNLQRPLRDYDAAVSALESYLKGDPLDAEPAINSDCKMCEWKDVCIAWAEERNDSSLLFFVGDAMKSGFRRLGIRTVDDVRAQDPLELVAKVSELKKKGFFWPSLPDELIHRIVQRAKINKTNEPLIFGKIEFPKSDIEIHFDIEGDPTQDFIYLHGLLLAEKGKEPVYTAFFADRYEDEAKITLQLFEFLKKYEGVPVYHYAPYEKTTLKRLITKHRLNDYGVYEMLFGKNGTAIDLYQTVVDNSDWPLTSYSVKSICKFLGFKWAAKDASGSSSIVWMNDYLKGDASMKDKILRYNEDDCQATLFLKDKLIEPIF